MSDSTEVTVVINQSFLWLNDRVEKDEGEASNYLFSPSNLREH